MAFGRQQKDKSNEKTIKEKKGEGSVDSVDAYPFSVLEPQRAPEGNTTEQSAEVASTQPAAKSLPPIPKL
jgi:hypothetical protein